MGKVTIASNNKSYAKNQTSYKLRPNIGRGQVDEF